jgi:hypothetical protein
MINHLTFASSANAKLVQSMSEQKNSHGGISVNNFLSNPIANSLDYKRILNISILQRCWT